MSQEKKPLQPEPFLKKPKIIEREKKCPICDSKSWMIGNPELVKKIATVADHEKAMRLIYNDVKNHTELYGVKIGAKEICLGCSNLLTGLQNYFGLNFTELLKKVEAVELVRKIKSSETTYKKAKELLEKADSLPKEFIENLK